MNNKKYGKNRVNKSSFIMNINMWSGDFASHTHKMTNPTTWQIAKCHSPDQTEYPWYHLGIRLEGKDRLLCWMLDNDMPNHLAYYKMSQAKPN